MAQAPVEKPAENLSEGEKASRPVRAPTLVPVYTGTRAGDDKRQRQFIEMMHTHSAQF